MRVIEHAPPGKPFVLVPSKLVGARGLAANAALADLMQPYNVGKFNITVGLGGYRSATAIAAGAEYRFSNSTAVKAGIATNTANFDDLSYNMSTAFEF